ncbi:MAG: 50S ribosomal protein L35 [Planctomycetota bacterium]
MPKMKSHKGLRKRMKLTATGKIKRMKAGKCHLQTGKSPKRRRQLRKPTLAYKTFAKEMRLFF